MTAKAEINSPRVAAASHDQACIVHVVGQDVPRWRADVLDYLLVGDLGRPQHRIWFGGGAPPSASRVAPFTVIRPPLGMRSLAPTLESLSGLSGVDLLHIWSPAALPWAMRELELAARSGGRPLRVCVDFDLSVDVRRVARPDLPRPARADAPPIGYVAPTARAWSHVAGAGVDRERIAIVRDCVDFAAFNAADPEADRRALDLGAGQPVILLLPPYTRGRSLITAAWSAFLIQRVLPDAIVLFAAGQGDHTPAWRLGQATGHGDHLRCTPADWSLARALAIANVAVFTPRTDLPAPALPWALASGKPIVASAVHACAELLAHGQNARLGTVEPVSVLARRLLETLEDDPPLNQRITQTARQQAFAVFSKQRMIAQYRACYDNLLAGRPISHDVTDAALLQR